jgi:hypothetical protein
VLLALVKEDSVVAKVILQRVLQYRAQGHSRGRLVVGDKGYVAGHSRLQGAEAEFELGFRLEKSTHRGREYEEGYSVM